MPRIRTVKPEFWDSPSTARASAVARLAFIGMWNWADDFGRGTANLKELEGFIFPNDDISILSGGTSENFRRVVAEVSECFGVVFYTVKGRPYYAIPSWEQHQRNEKRATGKHPGPEHADTPLTCGNTTNYGSSENFRHTNTETPRSSGLGTGEQGNRGTGEETLPRSADADQDAPDAGALIPAPAPTPKKRRTYPAAFEKFWEVYPLKNGKSEALEPWKRAIQRADNDEIIAGAHRYATDPNRDPAHTKWAEGWLNGDRWNDPPLPPRHTTSGRPGPDQRAAATLRLVEAMQTDLDHQKAINQ